MSTENEGLLEVRDLKVHFPLPKKSLFGERSYVKAVDGVSFRVRKGTTFGIVGESGSGKTTIAKAIMGLVGVSGGSIRLEGNELVGIPEDRLKALRPKYQIVFQDPYSSLDPRKSVSELISEPIRLHHLIRDKQQMQQRVLELMETVGLAERLVNTYPHELDGGRRQRIGIARALALNPKFIVCDEPVSALDVSIQAQILNLLGNLQEQMGLTYIFITHDLSVVNHFADDIAVMYLGQLVEKAGSEELFAHPMHPYTEALLSAIPVPSLRNRKKRIVLKGEITSPVNLPQCCHFAARCPYATEECFASSPELREVAPDHFVACHRVK